MAIRRNFNLARMHKLLISRKLDVIFTFPKSSEYRNLEFYCLDFDRLSLTMKNVNFNILLIGTE